MKKSYKSRINQPLQIIDDLSPKQYTDYIDSLVIRTIHRPSLSSSDALLMMAAETNKKINCIKFFMDTKSNYYGEVYSLKISRDADILFGIHCPPCIRECWLEIKAEKSIKIHMNNKQDKDGYIYLDTPLLTSCLPYFEISLHYTYYPWFKLDEWNHITLIKGLIKNNIRVVGNMMLDDISKLYGVVKDPVTKYAIMGPDNNYIITTSPNNDIDICDKCKHHRHAVYQEGAENRYFVINKGCSCE